MKKVILVMSIFLGIFSGTTAFATDQKSDGMEILTKFMNRQDVIVATYANIFEGKDIKDEESSKKAVDFIKKLEGLKKEVINAKKNTSKTIVEDKVNTFNKVLENYVDLIDAQISFLNLALDKHKSGKVDDETRAKQEAEHKEMEEISLKVAEAFIKSVEELMK